MCIFAVALAKGAVRGDGMKGESAITKVQNFEDDDVLFQFCQNPDVIRYAREFVGPDIKSVHTSTTQALGCLVVLRASPPQCVCSTFPRS